MYGDLQKKLAGLKYGLTSRDESFICSGADGIDFGMPVFGFVGEERKCGSPVSDQAVATFSGNLITGNIVSGSVNGEAIKPVLFDTDNATTMAKLVAELEANEQVDKAVLTSANVVTVNTFGTTIAVILVVTGGTTQATVSVVNSQSAGQVYLGVARFDHKESAGIARFEQNDVVPVMTQGEIYVVTGETVQANTKAYVRADGTFGNSGTETDGVFKENIDGAGLCRLYIGGERG